ncbi:MAG: DUF885 domain-containing protein [Allosphingosinicella sp.]|uniref:DUF885 domain-containing protein n=1 Tax=Allosphingosinicella sp. TaxID=2823234 RepID=UPI00393B29E8
MIAKSVLLASAAALLLAACAAAPAPAPAPAAPPAPAMSQSEATQRLPALFARSDDAALDRNPLQALARGDMRNADRFGNYLEDAYFEAERAAHEAELRELLSIDRAALSPTDRIAYDVFRRNKEQALKGLRPEVVALSVVRPINHFTGMHTFYPQMVSGRGAAPFRSLADYENNLKRMDGFAAQIDRAVERFREGMARGVTHPRLVVANVVRQLDTLTADGVEGSPMFLPVRNFPEGVPASERPRLEQAYRDAIGGKVNPAFIRLRDFLRDEYLPAARESVGLTQMPGGAMLYDMAIESSTTLPLTADYVHQLGLSEVARIRGEMDAIRQEVGFQGDLAAFFEHIRTDPRFKPESAEALTQGYYEIGRKVDQRIGTLFRTLPRTPLEIRPYPDFIAPTAAGASYQQGAPDGSRPGVFYFNTYDLPSRITTIMETLYLHEAAPGHHFQVSLAQENEALPNFMRFGGNTAFVEGWALYAEKLGPELGLFTDPYQRFGHLDDEMLRAMRLVVDSGLHAKGWSRDQAIEYMLSNSAMGRTDATAEVERYIAIPGQALAYKIGQLKILELRARAREALGDRFDIREFHEQVLGTGALPLTVLEAKINDWIAGKRG